MSYCDNCLHRKVCGLENVGDEAMTYCCDKLAGSNDVISRQAVLDIVNNPLNIRLDEIIKKLPPVNPQPKIGKWKREEFPNFTSYFCDKCGRGWRHKFDRCPNCLAKMEGEE